MAAPVVVSRIQNRRGTQDQFEALYPAEYISASGASSSGVTVTVASTVGVYQYAKPFVQSGTGQFAPGTQVVSVDSPTQFTVNLPPVVPLSGATVKISKYNGTGGCPISEYPNILLTGELALCTDSKRMFMGSVNGEYIEISPAFTDGIFLSPLTVTLNPTPTYTVIPQLTYQATPFFNLLYDITDVTSPDWNVVGTGYSRSGTMKITATNDFVPIPNPPFPPITSVSLVDDGVDINLYSMKAVLSASVSSGAVSGITVIRPGAGYFGPTPNIIIDPPPAGTQATAVPTVSSGQVSSVGVTLGGSGYSTPPNVYIDPPVDINISFTAAYNGANIEISYKHDFPGTLTLSSSTIRWLPF